MFVEIIFEFLLEPAEIRKEMRKLNEDVGVLKAWRLELLTGVLKKRKKISFFVLCAKINEISVKFVSRPRPDCQRDKKRVSIIADAYRNQSIRYLLSDDFQEGADREK